MNTFAVLYEYDPENPAIAETRPEHRKFLRSLLDSGRLIGSGPFTDAEGGALIVISLEEGASVADVEKVMDDDPFTVAGLIQKRTVRPWNPVLNIWG